MTDKSSKRKNKDLRHAAYRRARGNIRSVIKPFWDRPLFDTGRAQVTFAGGDLDRAHTTDEFPAADLFRLVNHHCPPGGDDRATEGRLQGMHRALTEIGRALYGPEYMPNNTEPIARQVARLADSLGQPDEQPALQAVLNAIGATWPEEWRGVPVTVDRVVAAIRSYYTEQTQGQAIREARAAERANILGMLGITVNPGAAPGTQGAVAQIRNWADAQAETAERNTRANTLGAVLRQLHDELFRDSRRSEIPVPVTVPAADPTGYAGWLRDHLAQDAQQRRENLCAVDHGNEETTDA